MGELGDGSFSSIFTIKCPLYLNQESIPSLGFSWNHNLHYWANIRFVFIIFFWLTGIPDRLSGNFCPRLLHPFPLSNIYYPRFEKRTCSYPMSFQQLQILMCVVYSLFRRCWNSRDQAIYEYEAIKFSMTE